MLHDVTDSNDFKIVTAKRKGSRKITNNLNPLVVNKFHGNTDKDSAVITRRIVSLVEDIRVSDLYASLLASLREGLSFLGCPQVKQIVCFGLGHIGEFMASRYQCALLLCLKEHFGVDVLVYDPVFCESERTALQQLGYNVIKENCEGKHSIQIGHTTIAYLPHCPKQLTNNLLWANWSPSLKDCILISNSITQIIESHPKRILNCLAQYVLQISPYVVELPVINSFHYCDIFNDTAIHIFPPEKLNLIDPDFWIDPIEPQYPDDDVEFITNKLQSL